MSKMLFETCKMGKFSLKNRVVMAPMTRCRAIDNIPNELMGQYYAARASAGLLITEGVAPCANGLGYARIPGLYNAEQVKGWKIVTKAVHDKQGVIFAQLMHTGRIGHTLNLPKGAELLAPTGGIQVGGMMWTDTQGPQPHPVAREMNLKDIEQARQEFVKASEMAMEAGFDGVELHGANGYLLEQFMNPNANKRTDAYGVDRQKFVLEVAESVTKAIGGEHVGLRVSPYGVFNDMGSFDGIDDFYATLAKKLSNLGLTYIHVADMTGQVSPMVKQLIREHFKGTYILSGGYEINRAESELKEKKGDLVAFGRPYIANPDLVEKLKTGEALKEGDPSKFYTPGPDGYTII